MKKLMKCRRVLCMLLIMSMVMLTGCGNGGVSGNSALGSTSDSGKNSSDVYLTIQDEDITEEVLSLYTVLYIFNNKIKAEDLNDAAIQDIRSKIDDEIRVEYVEYKLAVSSDIILGESDYASIDSQTQGFLNYFDKDFLKKYNITEQQVNAMFERQNYIQQLQTKSLNDLKSDYLKQYQSDYGDKQFFTVYYVLFPSVKYDEDHNPVMAEDGESAVSLNDAEMQQQYEKAQELHEKAILAQQQGTVSGNLEQLAEEYNVDFVSGKEHNYIGAYNEDLNKVIESLEDGQISDVVETNAGYMIVRMDNKNDTDYKEFAIDSVAGKSAEALYPTLQSNWLSGSGANKLQADSSVFDKVDIKAICEEMNAKGYINSTDSSNE